MVAVYGTIMAFDIRPILAGGGSSSGNASSHVGSSPAQTAKFTMNLFNVAGIEYLSNPRTNGLPLAIVVQNALPVRFETH